MKASTVLSVFTALLVLFLAGSAFVLSYDALRALSAENGFANWRQYLWPLILDAIMIAAGLSVIRCNVLRERSLLPWVMVGVFTVASIVFNILHAPDRVVAQVIASLPPLVVFLALELLSGQLRSAVVAADKAHKRAQSDQKSVQDQSAHPFPMPVEQLQEQRQRNREQAVSALLAFYADNPGATQAEAGAACGRSRSWVGHRLRDLAAEGAISRNGDGIVVLDVARD